MARASTAIFGLIAGLVFVPTLVRSVEKPAMPPDFSGVWGRDSVTYESPISGPGPVRNTTHTLDSLVGDYANPVLTPGSAAEVKRHGDISAEGMVFVTPHNQCWPQSPPYILIELQMQMIQQPKEVLILYAGDHEIRHVRLNQSHPAHVTPSWYGDSVGHYEGDTLVVDTVGVAVKPFSMIDPFGTPYTGALHLVERYRLIDGTAAKEAAEKNEHENGRTYTNIVDRNYTGKGLQVELAVEDAGAFTTPWSAAVTYRHANGEWPEIVCAENPHDYSTGKDAGVPVARTPDF